jgi:hypothetical protein
MNSITRIQQEAELRRLTRAKLTSRPPASTISADVVSIYSQTVKRTRKLGGIGDIWTQMVPLHLVEHCTIEGLVRGTLTVRVDSSPHLYQLKQLLLAGLQDQLVVACRGCSLKKIVLRAGSAPGAEKVDDRRMDFD